MTAITTTTTTTATMSPEKPATLSATEFPRFPDLPTELRLEIWTFCLTGRRVFEMDASVTLYRHAVLPTRAKDYDRCQLVWSHRGQTPVIAHVCREAREVAFGRGQVYMMDDEGETDDGGVPCPP
ncbi:hypothetical protein C8A05DRAFT_38380 [Staphylotrichum tortipilum]|uniref:2EXR domain-containing protein n=1 Tax=Staphylotrichum tortipilum TaxID=2831512 RepID=A0AAN6MDB7_9PEZI|nr:hypothetical protein C8A05DRAFT_38380 [Staphylotrichum longicolle]